MPAIENVLKETAGVATGLLLFAAGGGSPAGVAAGAAAVSGIALWSMLQGMVEKSGLESRTAVNALRRRAFADLKTYEERMDVEGANAALADLLPHALPKGEALVEASFDPKGFPTSATALILAELAVLNSDLFGADAPRAGIKFAEDVIQTTLKAALETPEYYQKLQPHMTVEQNRRLAEMRDALATLQDTADSIKTDTTDLLKGQAKILAYFEAAEARGALKIGEAAGLNKPQVEALLKNFGHENVPLDQAEGLLLKAAEELRDLRVRMVRLSNADPEVARLKGERGAGHRRRAVPHRNRHAGRLGGDAEQPRRGASKPRRARRRGGRAGRPEPGGAGL